MVTEPICAFIYSGGRIFLSSALKVSFSCIMDLHMYPMDSQTCSLVIESYAFSNQNLNPVWHKKPLEYDEESIEVNGFTVRKITTNIYNHTYLTDHVTPRLVVSFHMDRTFTYYLYRTYIPSLFLVILSLATFHLPATAYPARIALIMTSFLASTFILQHASSEYTKVKYTTAIEIYLLVNICSIMIIMFEYIIVLHFHPDINIPWGKVSGKKENIKCRSTETTKCSYCNNNMIGDGSVPDSDVCERNVQVEMKSAKEKDKRKGKVVYFYDIDRVSQVIMPIVHTIFNIAYFAYFIPRGTLYSKE